jgi:hypothetical protein
MLLLHVQFYAGKLCFREGRIGKSVLCTRLHLRIRSGNKAIPLLEAWLTDIEVSKGRIRSSGTPAFVYADITVAGETIA